MIIKPIKAILKRCLSEEKYEDLRLWYKEKRKNFFLKRIYQETKKFLRLGIYYPLYYKWYSRNDIDPKRVIIIESLKLSGLSDSFRILYEELTKNYNLDIHIHHVGTIASSATDYLERCKALIRDIAVSRYVFMNDGVNIIGRIKFRKGTNIVQLWHACGAFKKCGFSTADLLFGASRKEMIRYPYYKYVTLFAVSSPEVIWAYNESTGLETSKIKALGTSRTDIFFNKDLINIARERFEYFMPTSKGKKVILYAPTFRGRVKKATIDPVLSIPRFYDALSEDYVLVLKYHQHIEKRPEIPEKYRHFAVDFSNVMDIEELLCVADVCITDYSSLIFEYSLFERPMIFFAYDLDEYFDWRGFYYDYDELTPGPIFNKNSQMIDYIQHIDEKFDKEKVRSFKEKFMSSCDGHSTERIMKEVFAKDLEAYRKPIDIRDKYTENTDAQSNDTYKPWQVPELSKEAILSRLFEHYPQVEGKKIIAYIVKQRKRRGYPSKSCYLDWQELWESLDESYAILYIPDGEIVKENLPDFPKNYQTSRFMSCKGVLTGSELLEIADVSVTDFIYEAATYEYAKQPPLIFIPEYRWYCQNTKDLESSTAYLKDNSIFFDDTKDLIRRIEDGPSQSVDRQLYTEAYSNIWHHFISGTRYE